MKATMAMTLDGLRRALRSRMHQMADEIETGYAALPVQRDTDVMNERGTRAGDNEFGGD